MKVEHYLARAKTEIENIASHHDSKKEDVVAALVSLSGLIKSLKAGLDEKRAAYSVMRDAEVKRAHELRLVRLANRAK